MITSAIGTEVSLHWKGVSLQQACRKVLRTRWAAGYTSTSKGVQQLSGVHEQENSHTMKGMIIPLCSALITLHLNSCWIALRPTLAPKAAISHSNWNKFIKSRCRDGELALWGEAEELWFFSLEHEYRLKAIPIKEIEPGSWELCIARK